MRQARTPLRYRGAAQLRVPSVTAAPPSTPVPMAMTSCIHDRAMAPLPFRMHKTKPPAASARGSMLSYGAVPQQRIHQSVKDVG
jgi:hypothetical protein